MSLYTYTCEIPVKNKHIIRGGWAMKKAVIFALAMLLSVLRMTAGADEWWQPANPANSPEARQGHSMVTLPDGRILLFGGQNLEADLLNDLYAFADSDWRPITATNPPPPRRDHSAWVRGSQMYVYGGYGENGLLNDLWVYDPEPNEWHQVEVTGPVPSARRGQSVTPQSNGSAILFGGVRADGFILNDLWRINQDNTFQYLASSNWGYCYHGAFMCTDDLIVFFGQPYNGQPGTITMYEISSGYWGQTLGGPPVSSCFSTVKTVNSKGEMVVFIFGGYDENGNESNLVYKLNAVTGELTQSVSMPYPVAKGAASVLPGQSKSKTSASTIVKGEVRAAPENHLNVLFFGGITNGVPTNNTLVFCSGESVNYTLTIDPVPTHGTVRVPEDGSQINCGSGGSDCTEDYPEWSSVTLYAVADAGYVFTGWGGDCSGCGNSPTCQVTLDAGKICIATFSQEVAPSSPSADNDGDGLPDSIEQGPNGDNPDYDGNGDQTPDCQQCGVTSFTTFSTEGRHYQTIELPPGQCFRNVRARRTFPTPPPSWVDLPFGYFSFNIAGLDPGECTTVTIHLEGEAPQTYYKYGPTPDTPVDHWYDFSYDGETGAEVIDETTMVLHFCDGKRGDSDLTVNGQISDPGGPASISAHAVLYFPYLADGGGNETELGIINRKPYAVSGTVSFYQANGDPATENIAPFFPGGIILGDKTFTIPGNGRITIPSEEIPSSAVSAVVSGDGDLAGYARFLTVGGQRCAVPGSSQLGSSLTVPLVVTGADWRTGIGIFNPNDEEVTVTIVDDSGSSSEVSLGAKSRQFFWVSGSPNHIMGNKNIAAAEVFESLDPGGDRAAISLGRPNLTELFVPTISFGAGSFTGVGLGNQYGDSAVTAFGYNGSSAETEVSLGLLPAGSKLSANLSSIFASDTLWAKIIAIAATPSPVGSTSIPLQGLASYGEGGVDKLGAVSLNALKFKDGIVGVVGSGASTRLSLVNPGTADADITATAYDSTGAVVGSGSMSIAAGTNMSGMVDSLVGGAALSSGDYVRIVSDAELYGLETIQDSGRIEMLPVLQ